jgi:hypothetical protein
VRAMLEKAVSLIVEKERNEKRERETRREKGAEDFLAKICCFHSDGISMRY